MKRLDALGDRLKGYEKQETSQTFLKGVPLYARIDGRSFSKFTRGMERPYDERMSNIMKEVTKYLVEETGACTGYTQSDEISLGWYVPDLKSDIFFAYKKQKLVSTLSALATAKFVQLAMNEFPENCNRRLPTFDARVFSVPNEVELMNCFLWRVQDAVKNSVYMASYHYFSHKNLQGVNTHQMKDKLMGIGINWNDYPRFFKEGSFFKKELYLKSIDEGDCLRSRVVEMDRFDKFCDLSTEERVNFIKAKSLDSKQIVEKLLQ